MLKQPFQAIQKRQNPKYSEPVPLSPLRGFTAPPYPQLLQSPRTELKFQAGTPLPMNKYTTRQSLKAHSAYGRVHLKVVIPPLTLGGNLYTNHDDMIIISQFLSKRRSCDRAQEVTKCVPHVHLSAIFALRMLGSRGYFSYFSTLYLAFLEPR